MPDYEETVEKQIQEAMARGDFDDLPGTGRRLELGDNDPAWWARRKLREMRHRDQLIEAARQVDEDRDRLWTLGDVDAVRAEVARLNRRVDEINFVLPAEDALAPMDPDESVRTWHLMHRLRTPPRAADA